MHDTFDSKRSFKNLDVIRINPIVILRFLEGDNLMQTDVLPIDTLRQAQCDK